MNELVKHRRYEVLVLVSLVLLTATLMRVLVEAGINPHVVA